MYEFHEENLVAQLSATSKIAKTAFALAAATRLLPMYIAYAKEADIELNSLPKSTLHTMWKVVRTDTPGQLDVLESAAKVLLNLMPSEDDIWNEYHPLAEDAIAAIVYALQAYLTNDPQESAWAARRGYEAADQFSIKELEIDFEEDGAELALLMHPIVQQELIRQSRDLELAISGDIESLHVISQTETLLDNSPQ